MAAMCGCPSMNTLAELMDGTLLPSVLSDVELHLAECALCRELFTELRLLHEGERLSRAASELLPEGTSIGRYRVHDILGSGAMGEVYAAHDPDLDRRIALKLLRDRTSGATAPEARARLLREAQALAKLHHPNVVAVHDVGTVGDAVFIAMELVDGETLSEWIRRRSPSWREIMLAFVQAGRGLQAAHSAGLVHRDFKPNNVMIGSDGRVRVTDFGLARLADASAGPPPGMAPSPSRITQSLTRTGAILGTPAYMALEQLEGRDADARSDQFAFCVALYEALYGERPFVADDLQSLAHELAEGNVRAAPRGTRVPARLREVLLRGLAKDPAARFASMEALLAALGRDPAKARHRWAGATVLVLLGTAAVVALARAPQKMVCGGAAEKLAGVWDPVRRQIVHNAFLATGKPFAEAAFATTAALLDTYATGWSAMHRDTCMATRARGEQSEEVMELRMECLDRRREDVGALIDLFARADAPVVERAVQATQSLPDLDECTHADALRQVVRPLTSAARERAKAARAQLATTEAVLRAGQYDKGQKMAEAAVSDARALGYAPLVAEALYWLGDVQQRRGDAKAAAATLLAAVASAESARDDLPRARALALLVWVSSERLSRYAEAHDYCALARAALARAGGDRVLETTIDAYEATILDNEGRYAEALALNERVLVRREQLFDANDMRIGAIYHNLGELHYQRGEYDAAIASHQRALAIFRHSFGDQHPWTALALNGLGIDLSRKGDERGAVDAWEQALRIREATLGRDHPELTQTLENLARAFISLHEPAKARALLQRLLALNEREGSNPLSQARAEDVAAELALSVGKLDEAMAHAQRELAIYERLGDAEHPEAAGALTVAGRIRLAGHAAAEAQKQVERAISILERHPADPGWLAEARFVLAQALWELGRDRARALRLAADARKHIWPTDRAAVERWLAARSAR
jgi:tetratricopeptide (TPR) repeat protein